MDTKFILSLAILAALAGGMFYYSRIDNALGNTQNIPKNIQEYSVGGEVLSIDGDVLVIKASKSMKGEMGDYMGFENKTVTLVSDTPISRMINTSGQISLEKASKEDIKVGSMVTVYSSQDINKQTAFTPKRLDIQP